MPYLNLDLDWFSHRKAIRLVGMLGAGADLFPVKLWAYVGKHHPETGRLEHYSEPEIESICGWQGEAGKLVKALMAPQINLLEAHENFFQVHDWKDHSGHLAAFKKRAKTAAKKRWAKYASSKAKAEGKQSPSRGKVGTVGKDSIQGKEEGLGEGKPLSPETLAKLYNDLTPDECPAVTTLSPARRTKARQYLVNFPKQEFWEQVFKRVHESKFLRGARNGNGHGNFRFDFDWMLTKGKDGSENVVKVYEGKYADER